MKHYLLKLLSHCAPENAFAQDAIEFAIVSGMIRLRYDFGLDVELIMSSYDVILSAYHNHRNQTLAAA